MKVLALPLTCLIILAFSSCTPSPKKVEISSSPAEFRDYWYKGKAELTRFELKQSRYGEIHEGYAVLVFVTEDLLEDEQVKRERGSGDAIPVLKLINHRHFWTGIYPYNTTTSCFTAVDFSAPVSQKLSFGASEWCGQVYTQLNLKGKKYKFESHSYFQDEGDKEGKIDAKPLEDSLFATIRIAPEKLPRGKFELIPSLFYCRLEHVAMKPYKAEGLLTARVDTDISEQEVNVYDLEYRAIDRKLSIFFEQKAPYKILGWKETYINKTGTEQRELTTVAVAKNTLFTDYWTKHDAGDKDWREQLGFEK